MEDDIWRIQSYLRELARLQYDSVKLPPFTLFFNPGNPLKYFNYAIPDEPCHGNLSDLFKDLRSLFNQRQRTARFEFFEAFAPDLPRLLTENDFVEEERQWSMLCTPGTFHQAPEVSGLEVVELGSFSSKLQVKEFLTVQMQGFDPQNTELPTEAEIDQFWTNLQHHKWHGYLAYFAGEPAAVALYNAPLNGICEVAGIATRETFRRRGIASRLTAHVVHDLLNLGVTTVCLTAEDESAGRVYQRIGFQPFSIMLAYIDKPSSQN